MNIIATYDFENPGEALKIHLMACACEYFLK